MKNTTAWRAGDFPPELPVFACVGDGFHHGELRIAASFDEGGIAGLINPDDRRYGEIPVHIYGFLGTGSIKTIYAPLTKAAREFVEMVREAARR